MAWWRREFFLHIYSENHVATLIGVAEDILDVNMCTVGNLITEMHH